MMTKINLQVEHKVFAATLSDDASTRALLAQLPLTITMLELNGNEKYANPPVKLPTDPRHVERIDVGDLLLYGADCPVLFYKSFASSYSYTKLGRTENASGLADVLGKDSVQITLGLA